MLRAKIADDRDLRGAAAEHRHRDPLLHLDLAFHIDQDRAIVGVEAQESVFLDPDLLEAADSGREVSSTRAVLTYCGFDWRRWSSAFLLKRFSQSGSMMKARKSSRTSCCQFSWAIRSRTSSRQFS